MATTSKFFLYNFLSLYQAVRDPTSGGFDLTKASVRVQASFITFASCVKHLEVTGKQKSGVRWEILPSIFFPERPKLDSLARGAPPLELQMTGKGSKHHLPHTTFRTDGGWEPYGTGRLPGGKGRPAERRWGSLGGWNTKPWGHPSSVPQTQGRLIATGTGADWSYPTSQPSLPTPRAASVRLVVAKWCAYLISPAPLLLHLPSRTPGQSSQTSTQGNPIMSCPNIPEWRNLPLPLPVLPQLLLLSVESKLKWWCLWNLARYPSLWNLDYHLSGV